MFCKAHSAAISGIMTILLVGSGEVVHAQVDFADFICNTQPGQICMRMKNTTAVPQTIDVMFTRAVQFMIWDPDSVLEVQTTNGIVLAPNETRNICFSSPEGAFCSRFKIMQNSVVLKDRIWSLAEVAALPGTTINGGFMFGTDGPNVPSCKATTTTSGAGVTTEGPNEEFTLPSTLNWSVTIDTLSASAKMRTIITDANDPSNILAVLDCDARGASDKVRVYECNKLGTITARWEPPGAPTTGQTIAVKNLTIDKILNVRYNGVLKVATLPLGTTTGVLAAYAMGDTIASCARCTGANAAVAGESGCLSDDDLEADDIELIPDFTCDVCSVEIPTISQWGVAAMALLTLAAGTVVLRRRRSGAMPV